MVAAGVADKFFEWWEKMIGPTRFLDLKSRLLPANDHPSGAQTEGGPANLDNGKVLFSGDKKYTIKEGKGFDALWFRIRRDIFLSTPPMHYFNKPDI
jgi:hypothetical protein